MTASPNGSPEREGTGLRYPARTKLAIAAVLALVVAVFVAAALLTQDDGDDPEVAISGDQGADDEDPDGNADDDGGDDGGTVTSGGSPVTIANGVEARRPGRDDEVLAQEAVAIDLAAGWTGELSIRSESGEAVAIPDDEVEVTSPDRISFTPGEGKVLERLPSGRTCVDATIWDQTRGRSGTERVETWCFEVT